MWDIFFFCQVNRVHTYRTNFYALALQGSSLPPFCPLLVLKWHYFRFAQELRLWNQASSVSVEHKPALMTSRKLNITTIRYPERRNLVLLFLLKVLGDSFSCQSGEDLRNLVVTTRTSSPDGIQSIGWFLPQEQQPEETFPSAGRQGQPWSCFLQQTREEDFPPNRSLLLAVSNTAPLM